MVFSHLLDELVSLALQPSSLRAHELSLRLLRSADRAGARPAREIGRLRRTWLWVLWDMTRKGVDVLESGVSEKGGALLENGREQMQCNLTSKVAVSIIECFCLSSQKQS